jgi:hypothetical protein
MYKQYRHVSSILHGKIFRLKPSFELCIRRIFPGYVLLPERDIDSKQHYNLKNSKYP